LVSMAAPREVAVRLMASVDGGERVTGADGATANASALNPARPILGELDINMTIAELPQLMLKGAAMVPVRLYTLPVAVTTYTLALTLSKTKVEKLRLTLKPDGAVTAHWQLIRLLYMPTSFDCKTTPAATLATNCW